jgi:hypothetical protein
MPERIEDRGPQIQRRDEYGKRAIHAHKKNMPTEVGMPHLLAAPIIKFSRELFGLPRILDSLYF